MLGHIYPDLKKYLLPMSTLADAVANIFCNETLMKLDPATLIPTGVPLKLFGGNSLRTALNAQQYAVYVGTTGQENEIGLKNEALRWLVTGGKNHPSLTWPCGTLIKDTEARELLGGETRLNTY